MAQNPLDPNAPKLVLIDKSSDVYPRQNILWLQQNKPIQFSLFIQAYNTTMKTNKDDLRSFYRIGGIHGLPYVPYNDSEPWENPELLYQRNLWGGYCHHGVITFPTWHRFYMLLIEKVVRDFAKNIVDGISDPDLKAQWEAEWKQLRFPYIDWATYDWVVRGIPDIFINKQISITKVQGNKAVEGVQVANPLRAFYFPADVGQVILQEGGNPFNRPFNPNHDGDPYCPAGFPTVRHPNEKYQTNDDALSLTSRIYVEAMLRPGVWQMFQVPTYNQFSNHNSTNLGDGRGSYGLTSSIEVVHDQVHDLVGGNGGQMSYPAVAGFDPIFFLHHCNVDRLFALWQECYPDSWMVPELFPNGTFTIKDNTEIDSKTPLTPFLGSDSNALNSDDCRNTLDWGYTYPEIAEKKEKGYGSKEFLGKLLKFYKPDKHYNVRWVVEFPNIDKQSQKGVFRIRVFVGLPSANPNTPISDPHFAGQIFVFARSDAERCPNCKNVSRMRGSIDITPTLFRLGIATHPEQLDDDGDVFVGDQNANDPNTSNGVLAQVASQLTVVVSKLTGEQITDTSGVFTPALHFYASVHEPNARFGALIATPESNIVNDASPALFSFVNSVPLNL